VSTNSIRVEIDNNGNEFPLSSCSHTYAYDANGRMVSDTAVSANHAASWVKTYTYNNAGQMTAESAWIKQ
jgi:hypothetical protein